MAAAKRTEIEAVSRAFGSLTITVGVLRLYTRIRLTDKAGWDDALSLFHWQAPEWYQRHRGQDPSIQVHGDAPNFSVSYNNFARRSRRSTSGYELSGPDFKLKPSPVARRMPDQSLIETHIDAATPRDDHGSQENILQADKAHEPYIMKTTGFRVHEHG
ncbi:uncharacterized protein BO97DRAFT_413891 [Aspergillus homomorphus CBS 101889]|uniref:Uncharacterized protein n=1 Tax=Aspergillus homomorphus (strain CBS 101889) TaxID=1450537 RepID=A0A395HZQ8_ASPHC|nr:hypothetical protein BO97DRAFT_413891 [Aspergillus homomorphus CBS 101889]RAL12975.1 hypothetical protein BO97DRAFT_413891 [Aspergillus homomorphus CBS 101889]